jgi:hypothetical protein
VYGCLSVTFFSDYLGLLFSPQFTGIITFTGRNIDLRVSENRVLGIFGPKRDEVTGGWRKLHNEKLHNEYPSPSVIR